jgi:ADP-heptose:LPS heptosyltransferase
MRNPEARIHVLTNVPGIFDRNPDVDGVSSRDHSDTTRFHDTRISYSAGFPYQKHFLEYCCECLDINDAIALRTYVYPAREDAAWAEAFVSKLSGSLILINRTAGSNVFRKTWPAESWKKLGANLARSATIVDISTLGEPLDLPAGQFVDLSGQTTVHQLAALMRKARALISVDSGPMHLAAAVNLPTVCLLGGVYPPVAIRYPNSRILSNRPACADCEPLRHCDFGTQCLANIKVQDVLAALDDLCPAISANSPASKTARRPRSSDFCHPSSVR